MRLFGKVWVYLCARFKEGSTWTAIVAGVTIAAALGPPWSYVSIACSVAGALTPTSRARCAQGEGGEPQG